MEEATGQAETEEAAEEVGVEMVQPEGRPGDRPEEGQEEVRAAQKLKGVLDQGLGELGLDQEEPEALQGLEQPE
jgi:hypothetical protein